MSHSGPTKPRQSDTEQPTRNSANAERTTRSNADAELGLDVAIIGGGLAGNLLARQLLRTRPELSVGLFERETGTSYKVGEASVEITAN